MSLHATRKQRTLDNPSHPLCFKVLDGSGSASVAVPSGERLFRFDARVLSHMQKEGVVGCGNACAWRLTSDEGPLMRATDLAPAPLPLFNAAMQFAFLERLLQFARAHRVVFGQVGTKLQNFYSLAGSFTRRDIQGEAYPALLHVEVESDAPADLVGNIVQAAAASSIAETYFRAPLLSTFSLYLNGRRVVAARRRGASLPQAEDPGPRLDRLLAAGPAPESPSDIVTKLATAANAPPAPGDVAPNLRPEQDRQIEVRGTASTIAPGHLVEAAANLHPSGSVFQHRADVAPVGPQAEAPCAMDYIAASIGFCFMTQLHRFIAIGGIPVDEVRMVQFTPYKEAGSLEDWTFGVSVAPIDTNVFVEGRANADQVIDMLSISQRTCFLHRALHSAVPSVLSATLNGRAVHIPNSKTQAAASGQR